MTFQETIEQIARENGITPEAVLTEIQAAIDEAYENPTERERLVQNAMFQGRRPTPEELVSHIAALLQGNSFS